MTRRLLVGFSALLLAVTAVSGAFARPAATQVHHLKLFKHGAIAPGVRVRNTASGACTHTSYLESRRYTWRCSQGRLAHDPCFSPTKHASFVLCPAKPWSSDVLRLRLTGRLPHWHYYPYNPALPLGIWTSNGARCVHSAGTGAYVGGKPITYLCRGGAVLVGQADTNFRAWTIDYGQNAHARQLLRVGITDAWW